MADITRRTLLRLTGATVAGLAAGRVLPNTGSTCPRSAEEAGRLDDLVRRGEPEVWSGDALLKIGMPVGGCFAGTVYLSGDGRLWNWDIFNDGRVGAVNRGTVTFQGQTLREADGANYMAPVERFSPFEFGVTVDGHALDASGGWEALTFRGTYPIGTVNFRGHGLAVRLEAFSPFIPHEIESSSYPATVLRYRIENAGETSREVDLEVAFGHPVLALDPALLRHGEREFRALRTRTGSGWMAIANPASRGSGRPDIMVEDWSSGNYDRWTVEGTAFGQSPIRVSEIAGYQGDVRAQGEFVVNSHHTRGGEDVAAGDTHVGKMTSRPFTIERRFLAFRIGGGRHPGKTGLQLVVDGSVVRSATGHDANAMRDDTFEVSEWIGKSAQLVILDQVTGAWGNVGIGTILQTDQPPFDPPLELRGDFGTFAIAVEGATYERAEAMRAVAGRRLRLGPGGHAIVHVLVGWHFPNLRLPGFAGKRRWLASRWKDAGTVVEDLDRNLPRLRLWTFRWRDTWYDSTLPYWFLDRTFVNTSTLATSTCHRFEDGRYWFWEGVGCCAGTCTHVWSYAQAIARVFPEVERRLREEVDFGLAFHEKTGAIDYRAEFGQSVAHDGQCGCILRAYREHQMARDRTFLERIYPRVRKATEYLIAQDPGGDGLLEGAQYNTLDAAWYGPMGWMSSLYVAALRAAGAMATEQGDTEFAERCNQIAARGSRNLVAQLFNGEYFIHKPDPAHPEANNTNDGCHIDQLYGQSWAHQVGLPRVVPEQEARTAMAALFRHNFVSDVGAYRRNMKAIKGGRWYAAPGEPGLIMCTFPRGGADRATGKGQDEWAAMYFNECMTGFEYQAAAHMIAEDLVEEGLTVVRAIHDRYSATKRNPFNEVECSDHYGRAMASFGAYLALCGYRHHGPKGQLSFEPKVGSEHFRAAFLAADGWGTYEQRIQPDGTLDRQFHYRYKRAERSNRPAMDDPFPI